MAGQYRIEHIREVPHGWKVRTVMAKRHRVRVAFSPGPRREGSGVVVEILHPRQENPCIANPAELVLMGVNPMSSNPRVRKWEVTQGARTAIVEATSKREAKGEFIRIHGYVRGYAPIHARELKGSTSKVFGHSLNPLSRREAQKAARERATRIREARLGNPSTPYDRLSTNEKLAFGRLGLGKAQLQTAADIRRARAKVVEVNRFRNRFPNPAGGAQAIEAQELAGEFKHAPSEKYFVATEPHIPAGDYARLGDFIGIAVKPVKGGQVQEISFPGKVILISDAAGRQLHLVGPQPLADYEIDLFTGDSVSSEICLGEGRAISYRAVKWHLQVEDQYRGKNLTYEHQFGEEGGSKPQVFYSKPMERLLIRGGDYTVEGVGIRN